MNLFSTPISGNLRGYEPLNAHNRITLAVMLEHLANSKICMELTPSHRLTLRARSLMAKNQVSSGVPRATVDDDFGRPAVQVMQ